MPNFKKSKGYAMKGFSGFGNSPAKVSDSEILKLQSKLNHSELDFKEPGWAKIAGQIHGKAMNPMGGGKKGGGGDTASKVSGAASDVKGAADTAKSISSMFGDLGGGL